MITAPYMAYSANKMKYSYQAATNVESKPCTVSAPVDFNDISAPETMPAGATYCYESRPGIYFDMQRSFRRAA